MPGPTPNEMTSVPGSSNILGYRYDPATQKLTIEFRQGGVYHYHGVPSTVVNSLGSSDSAGSFFHRHIKGRYHHQQE